MTMRGDRERPPADESPRQRWRRLRRAAQSGTRSLLDQLAEGDPEQTVRLGDLLTGLGPRAYGVLMLLAIPPSFVPGVASAVSSPITILVGLQLLIGLKRPWLPKWLGKRGPQRKVLVKFDTWFAPWFERSERWIKPRRQAMLDHRAANLFTGMLLVLLGILLALPIPMTNALFGVLLLLFALALLERDGNLMLLAWLAGSIAVVVFGILSGSLATLATSWAARWL